MAAIMGKDGFFSATTSTAGSSVAMTFIDSWSLNPGVNTAEVTAFGDTWEKHEPTIKNWSATVSGSLDRTDGEQAQMLDQLEDGTLTDAHARFYISSSTVGDKYWYGAAIVESWTIDSAVKDKAAFSLNLKGNGALTYTTTTS
jgi:predicted secreted protein